jgi:hypothetical protein
MSGAGLDSTRSNVVFSSSYFWKLHLKLSQVFCRTSGSRRAQDFHNSSLKDFKVRSFLSISFRLTQAGQVHVSLASIASCLLAL